MNYKVMKRPMFRLGGSARPGYQSKGLVEIEDLIKQRAAEREKFTNFRRGVMPLQVLAGQPGLQTIRKPTDVLSILSDIGQDPNLFNALIKSRSLDLDMKDKDLKDKITLAKLKEGQNKTYEFERRLNRANKLKADLSKYITEQKKLGKSDEQIKNSGKFREINRDIDYLLRETSLKEFLRQARLKDPLNFDIEEVTKDYYAIGDVQQEFKAEGGRIGYQEGTPEPMMKETISVEETLNPVKEQPQESSMSVKQMYDLMRQRIPQANVSDKDLYKIASSEQIMADFASLETMSDVTQFNEQYDTNIVLDLPIVG
jgi:hypothetical protein